MQATSVMVYADSPMAQYPGIIAQRGPIPPQTELSEKIAVCKAKYDATMDSVAQKVAKRLGEEVDITFKSLDDPKTLPTSEISFRIGFLQAAKDLDLVLPQICSEGALANYFESLAGRISNTTGVRVQVKVITKADKVADWVIEFSCFIGQRYY